MKHAVPALLWFNSQLAVTVAFFNDMVLLNCLFSFNPQLNVLCQKKKTSIERLLSTLLYSKLPSVDVVCDGLSWIKLKYV